MRKILFSLLAVGLFSCINEKNDPSAGQLVTISLAPSAHAVGTRADGDAYGSGIDNNIREFRILVFHAGGKLAYNEYIADITNKSPYTIQLMTGTYDFVFIANEGSDNDTSPALTATLDAYDSSKTIADFGNSVVFRAAAFADGKNIPMSALFRNVKIMGDNHYKINGTEQPKSNWLVMVTRLGIRVDVTLTTGSKLASDSFRELIVGNLPATVPVLAGDVDNKAISYAASRTYNVTDGEGGGFTATAPYRWVHKRIILPSSLFSPADRESDAIFLELSYADGYPDEKVALALSPTDYTSPRNAYYLFTGDIIAHQFRSSIIPWEEEEFPAALEGMD
jgi:hypothetical protein